MKDDNKASCNSKTTDIVACQGCGVEFASRNAVFRHLRETNGECLKKNEADYKNFLQYVQTKEYVKVLVLYGYIPSSDCLVWNYKETSDDATIYTRHKYNCSSGIVNGDDAGRLVWEAVQQENNSSAEGGEREPQASKAIKVNRSYGWMSRGTDIVAQDDGTSVVSEVLMIRVSKASSCGTTPQQQGKWMTRINEKLRSTSKEGSIRVLGCLEMPQKKFNAEMDVTHVWLEYMLPADFLYTDDSPSSLQAFFDRFVSFDGGDTSFRKKEKTKPSPEALTYLYHLKKLMQSLTTKIEALDPNNEAAMMEKSFHVSKRQQRQEHYNKNKRRKKKQENNTETQEKKHGSRKPHSIHPKTLKKGKNVLRRRRFHNFTPRVMAHEFLAYRRLDRFHHVETKRYCTQQQRPFIILGLSGDLFLNGQACRVVGLFIALARKLVDPDIVECMFDEEYPHLVPAPPAPSMGLYARDAAYTTWEGKTQTILSPRVSDRYYKGWNSRDTLQRVEEWQHNVQEEIARAWLGQDDAPTSQEHSCGRLHAERQWTKHVLEPWAKTAQTQLQQYREWKKTQEKESHGDAKVTAEASITVALPITTKASSGENESQTGPQPLENVLVDATVPQVYVKVLQLLQKADTSGLWPSTTPKRQLVMISSLAEDSGTGPGSSIEANNIKQPASLSMAHMIAKSNKKMTQSSSAYSFAEGQGGASGSFSVGYMPNDRGSNAPKSNLLFPELVRAAFELEIALCPHREPSSTIAINRNAQFRPHVDSGAGAGQGISLIVGLGTYTGGELVVEGDLKDIRYKPIEFNGWKQRHWTMPFSGERYSLVWFTPKGCEGKRGIDLDPSQACHS